MTKEELAADVEVIIKRNNPDLDVSKRAAKAVIGAVASAITNAVADGQTVYLRGFGTFGPKLRQTKIARNIKEGTPMEIPAHYIPEFTPNDEFKRVVRESVKVETPAFDDNALY